MKIFTADQIYEADKSTIKKQQITSEALMERAATKIFDWMHSRLKGGQVKIHLFCGIGNNGGDGIALARHLYEHGYAIEVYVVNFSEKRSPDFLINLDRLKDRKLWPEFLDGKTELPEISPNDIIVDAIFGIGLNRKPDEWVGQLIMHLNASNAFVLSVDIPSGLPSTRSPWNRDYVVQSNYVLSFQVPKLVFFLPGTGVFLNQWEILDIGLDPEYLHTTETDFELMGKSEILPLYRPRLKFSHKGTFGHSLLIGGSYGKMGAVQLASRACLLVGSGLVTAFVPECGYDSLQGTLPELMVITDEDEDKISEMKIPMKPKAIGLGMGMGTHEKTIEAFANFLKTNKTPLVIDADGINMLSIEPGLKKLLPKKSVLTPHPKELERLIGKWEDDFDKISKTKAFSTKNDCIVVIKGAHSMVIYRNKGYINSTGNPGMATAGSGDVLTGMITGLIAQDYEPLHAAIFGVYLHGLAGDIGASVHGYEALTASGIVENIGKSYLELLRVPEAENGNSN